MKIFVKWWPVATVWYQPDISDYQSSDSEVDLDHGDHPNDITLLIQQV